MFPRTDRDRLVGTIPRRDRQKYGDRRVLDRDRLVGSIPRRDRQTLTCMDRGSFVGTITGKDRHRQIYRDDNIKGQTDIRRLTCMDRDRRASDRDRLVGTIS